MKDMYIRLLKKMAPSIDVPTICPVCDRSNVTFLPLPKFYREEARKHGYKHFGRGEMISINSYSCSTCGASDRERLYAHWMDSQIRFGRLKKNSRLLHFAPEAPLSKKLSSVNFFDYKTADLYMPDVDYRIDIMNMPILNESIDFFICSHVLEHVESDDKAIQELYRVTKKGGCGILMAPICIDLEHTIEDPTIKTDAERWRHYGQHDHVRLYAHNDYVKKIKSSGFEVEELGKEEFGVKTFMQLGVTETSILYIVKKP